MAIEKTADRTTVRDNHRYVAVRPRPMRTVAEFRAFLRTRGRAETWPDLSGLPHGNGGRVLVLPVIGRTDHDTMPLRAALDRLGHTTHTSGLGRNFGPTAAAMAGVLNRTRRLADRHGPISIVGLSMGGLFARWAAHEIPDCVQHVATVCSPFRQPLQSVFTPLGLFARAWDGGLASIAAVEATPSMPWTAIYSRRDGIVAWRSCMDPDAPEHCYEANCDHVGMSSNHTVLNILANRLAPSRPAPRAPTLRSST